MTCCDAQDRREQNALSIKGLRAERGGSGPAVAHRERPLARCTAASKSMMISRMPPIRCDAQRTDAPRSDALAAPQKRKGRS
ncbi:hypothetical protein WS62_15505 [Burkholderia sp. ABCPW 14]|nr:hypothetical protein WS62_15505 [Burkholderia sp. ABCPW 14]